MALTLRALSVGRHAEQPYRSVLSLLAGCPAGRAGTGEQERGASYEQLAAIARRSGMGDRERWYEIARAVPLSELHANHILGRLRRAPFSTPR